MFVDYDCGIESSKMGTYSSHGVDAVYVVVGPAGSELVGILLFLNEHRKKTPLGYNIKHVDFTSGKLVWYRRKAN